MTKIIFASATLLGLILSGSAANAGETVTYNQNNAINIEAIINIHRNDDTNVVVNQSGLYNSVGSVNFGTGGYISVYQQGQTNQALIGQFGRNQTALVGQVQDAVGIFSQFGVMGRR